MRRRPSPRASFTARAKVPQQWVAVLVAMLTVTTTGLVDADPAQAASSGATVRVAAGSLRMRTGPSTQAPIVGQLANRTKLSIACQVTGQYVAGAVRRTSQWDRLHSGRYVSHAFVATTARIAACAPAPPPSSRPAPGPVGTMSTYAFVAAAAGPARQTFREYGVPASVTIAQAIFESGWGRSALTVNDRNYFGIKCFDGYPGLIAKGCHSYRSYECRPGCVATTTSFRTYATISDSFRDHGRFLVVNDRYRPAFAYSRNANLFLYRVWKAGYATSPTYYDDLTALMRQYNLYRYDLG